MSKKLNKGSDLGVLCFVDTIKLDDKENTTATSEIQIFPDGEVYHPSGERFVFNDTFRDQVVQSFENSGIDCFIDFNHSANASDQYDQNRAAGWIVALENKGTDGLYGLVEWNEIGIKAIQSKEYKYLSPEWSLTQFDKTGQSSDGWIDAPKLWNVSLTNKPFLESMIKQVELAETKKETLTTEGNEKEKLKMDNENNTPEVTEELDIEETTDEETTTEEVAENTGEVAALEAKLAAQIARAEALEAALLEQAAQQRDELVANAMSEGRVTPAMLGSVQRYADTLNKDADGGVKQLTEFLATLPRQTMSEPEGAIDGNEQGDADAHDATAEMTRKLGLNNDTIKNFNNVVSLTADGQYILEDGTKVKSL